MLLSAHSVLCEGLWQDSTAQGELRNQHGNIITRPLNAKPHAQQKTLLQW